MKPYRHKGGHAFESVGLPVCASARYYCSTTKDLT